MRLRPAQSLASAVSGQCRCLFSGRSHARSVAAETSRLALRLPAAPSAQAPRRPQVTARQSGSVTEAEQQGSSAAVDSTRRRAAHDWTGELQSQAPPAVPWHVQDARLLVGRKAADGQTLLAMTLRLNGADVDVVPLWVAIHQLEPGQTARIYKALRVLSEDSVGPAEAAGDAIPAGTASGLRLLPPDELHGPWHNYLVGLEGSIAATELDTYWPNRVLHGERVAFNLRDGADVAGFLSEAELDGVLQHMQNLQAIQKERSYRPGYVHQQLCNRYGRQAVDRLGIDRHFCDWDSQKPSMPSSTYAQPAEFPAGQGMPAQPNSSSSSSSSSSTGPALSNGRTGQGQPRPAAAAPHRTPAARGFGPPRRRHMSTLSGACLMRGDS